MGDNPTFDDVTDRRIEAFVHDFDGDLYGATVEVTVHAWLRGMVRCHSLQELIEKTAADVAASRIALDLPAQLG
jgi:riboflavin kinase/FMN adenylyltransferase